MNNTNYSPEDIIRQHVQLPAHHSSGWFAVLCRVCNDHGRKGPRAGFKFDNNGQTVGYHCFNCECAATFDGEDTELPSKQFKRVLKAFNVPVEPFTAKIVANKVNFKQLGAMTAPQVQPKRIEPERISLLKTFYPLEDDKDDDVAQFAISELTRRGVDWKSQPFFLSRETGTVADRWVGRLIIPIYKDGKLIYYTGRDLSDLRPNKYLNASADRGRVFYGFDTVRDYTSSAPILITEGWFDAVVIDGVCILGRIMSDEQIEWLNRNPREKIVVLDRDKAGLDLATQAINLNWSVSTPDFGSSCKDVNEAVVKYGKLFAIKEIYNTKSTGQNALTKATIYCRNTHDE